MIVKFFAAIGLVTGAFIVGCLIGFLFTWVTKERRKND